VAVLAVLPCSTRATGRLPAPTWCGQAALPRRTAWLTGKRVTIRMPLASQARRGQHNEVAGRGTGISEGLVTLFVVMHDVAADSPIAVFHFDPHGCSQLGTAKGY
jgi:hypothetical protein